ncbi:MAG TPA: amidohydrolase family protein [Casimicrobiaceae bacterium]
MSGRQKGGGLRQLQRLYYDTALSTSEYALAALRQFVPASQILFGSDFPYAPDFVLRAETSGLESSKLLDDAARKAIYRENAAALFPRFT